MATEGEKIRGLHDFFVESFTAFQLEMFLKLKGYREVALAVNPNVGAIRYCFNVAEELDRLGLINDAFFVRLTGARPAKEALIRGLQESWLAEEKSTPQHQTSVTPLPQALYDAVYDCLFELAPLDETENFKRLLSGLPKGIVRIVADQDFWNGSKSSKINDILDCTGETCTKDGRSCLGIVLNNAMRWVKGSEQEPILNELIESVRRSRDLKVLIGVSALRELLEQSQAQQTDLSFFVQNYRDDFLNTIGKLDELNHYKRLHALLHKLQFEVYTVLVIEVSRPSRDRLDWEVLGNHAKSLGEIVPELLESSIFGKDQIAWLPNAQADLLGAIKEQDFGRLEDARNGLGRVVTTWPSLLMAKLKQAAQQLRLDRLVTDLSVIRDRADGANLSDKKVALLGSGVQALSIQEQHLKLLIKKHDLLQKIETHVRVISRNPATVPDELKDSWQWMNESVIGLCSDANDNRAESLRQYRQKMTDAIESENRSRVADTFSDFRGVLVRYFLWVDETLKESCGEVQKIGKPLAEIVEMLD